MINSYIQYNTQNPMMIPHLESRGVPDILKDLTEEVYNRIISKIENPTKSIMIWEIEDGSFKIENLHLSVNNEKRKEIYAISKFGVFNGEKLISPIIDFRFNFEEYDSIDLKRVILHELLHIYEIYNRLKNKSKKDLQWKLNNIIMSIRPKYKDKLIEDISYLIYLSMDQEINARVAEVYKLLMDGMDLKDTYAIKYKNYLEDFEVNSYIKNYDELMKFFIELNTNMSKISNQNFKLYKIPENKTDIDRILKQWSLLFKKKSKYFNEKLLKVVDEVNLDIKLDESAWIDIDDSKEMSSKYITKYDTYLLRQSNLNSIYRNNI